MPGGQGGPLVRSPEPYVQWEGRGHFMWRLMPLCWILRVPAPYPDPLESKREVCELNPDCDELADHIGFQEAYWRFYGTA